MAELSASIANARRAGYSDADIAAFIAKDPRMGPQVAAARKAGYSDADIVAHLGKPNVGKDVVKSGGTGILRGGAGIADSVMESNPVTGTLATLTNAARVGDMFAGRVAPVAPNVYSLGSRLVDKYGHKAETALGQLADTAGTMLPNVFAPGSIPQRVAAWAIPTLTTEAAGHIAQASGADERGQQAARVAGAVVGAGASSVRPGNVYEALRQPARPRPSVASMRAAKDTAYRAVDESGARYAAGGLKGLFGEIDQAAAASNINEALHPRAWAMLQSLKTAGRKSMSLTELDQLRQVIRRDVVNRGDEAEAFFGKQMIDAIDGYIEGAAGRQMKAGSGPQAAQLITDARRSNSQYRKAESVTDAVDRAKLRASTTGTGGNQDNAIRQELRKLLETTPNLLPEEAAALEKAARGGPVQNILRLVGKLSPNSGAFPLLANLGVAGATGGKSIALSAAGYGAKLAADAITTRNVGEVLDVIARGSKPEAEAALLALGQAAERDPQLREAYRQAMLRGGVVGATLAIPAAASAEEQPPH